MISLLCPTRQRVDAALTMARTALETSEHAEILFYVDNDDVPPPRCTTRDIRIGVVRGPRDGVGRAWNRLAKKATGDIFGMCNDDLRYTTPDWDAAVARAFPKDGIAVVYANDAINGEEHCAFPFVTRKWYEALGYFVPEHFGFFYHDTWLFDVAKRLNRTVYLPDVHIPHYHNMSDQVAIEARLRARNDPKIWNDTEHLREKDADKLRVLL